MKFSVSVLLLLSLSGCLGSGLYRPAEDTGAGGGNVGKQAAEDFAIYSMALNASSPSSNHAPIVSGTAHPSCDVQIFTNANCTGAVVATGVASGDGSYQLNTVALPEGPYDFSAKCLVPGTNSAVCMPSAVVFVVDRTGPTLTVSAPSHSIANHQATVSYTVSYSENSTVSLTPGQITLNTTGSASCAKSVASTSATSAVVELASCTGEGTVGISIAANSAVDHAGNSAAASPASSTFAVDNTGFGASSLYPAAGDYSTIPSSIQVLLSETIDPASVTAGDFSISGSCPGISIASVSVSGSDILLALLGVGGCVLMETVSVDLNLAGVQDAAGNYGSGNVAGVYRMNNVGPTSAVFAPVAGAVNPIPSSVTVTFPQNVNTGTVSGADFSISGTCGGASVSSASASGAVATVNLGGVAGCANGQTVGVTVNLAGIQDTLGNAGSGTASATWTKDTSGPTVALSSSGGTVSAMPTSITATFAADTVMSTVTAADISVSGSCPVSLGAVNKSGQAAVIHFNGTNGCVNGESFTVSVNLTGIDDGAGNAGVGSQAATFDLDTQAPSVILGVNSSMVASIPASITATFSADTDMSTVGSSLFALGGTCVGASIGSVVKAGNIATVNLNNVGSCVHGQTVILNASVGGVEDLAGNVAIGTQSATLTLDTTSPGAVFGQLSATLNPLPVSAAVTFDADTDMSTVSTADFTLGGTCGLVIIGSVVKVGKVATVHLAGTGGCPSGSTLTVNANLAGVLDMVGNVGVGSQSATYLFDNIGPTANLGVAAGNVNPLPTSIPVTFAADTDMSTVTAADFSLAGTCGSTSISSISKVGQIATVNIAGTLMCPSLSTMTLNTNLGGVADLIGNAGIGSQSATYLFDNVAPLISLSVAAGTYKPFPTSIDVTFSSDTDMSTVNVNAFILTGTCLSASIGSVVKTANVVTVNFSGTAGCSALSTMIFTTVLAGIADSVGNLGVGVSAAVYVRGL